MELNTKSLTRYALLIGIDSYQRPETSTLDLNLAGCVNDALAVETFLKDMRIQTNIIKLLAPCDDDPATVLPTHDNIIGALEEIRDSIGEVDLLYVHYSGHGIRLTSHPSNTAAADSKSGIWMALSTHDAFAGGKYLTGRRFGTLIQEIIDKKGTRVCLVLDSCFSGGGFRNPKLPNVISSTFRPRCVDAKTWGGVLHSDLTSSTPGSRNTAAISDWMINPAGCTILAASGMNQEAGEDEFGNEMRGLLTHWTLKVLREHMMHKDPTPTPQDLSLAPSYARLAHEVTRKIQTTLSAGLKTPQTPAVRGDVDFRFFSNDIAFEKPTCEVLQVEGYKATIDVGTVHGVAAGAIYNIFSSNIGKRELQIRPMQICISNDNLAEFHSTGDLIDTAMEGENKVQATPELGDLVVLKQWAYPEPVFVDLQHDHPKIKALKAEIQKPPILNCGLGNNRSTNLRVSINTMGNFEVHQPHVGRLHRVPEISADDSEASPKVAKILRHIARYRAIEGLLCKTPGLRLDRDKFKINCLVVDKEESLPQDRDGRYITQEGTPFDFSLTFFGKPDSSVWMAVFELNASWGIRKLYPEYGQNADEVTASDNEIRDIENGGEIQREFNLRFEMKTHIPQKCVQEDPLDIVDQYLVFVCHVDDKSPPSWDEISLPSLPTNNSLLDTDDGFGAYRYPIDIDKKVKGGKRPGVVTKKKRRSQLSRRWNVIGFQVHTFPKL